jgi:hypothetical protein
MHRSRLVFYTRIGWPVWAIPTGTAILYGISIYCDIPLIWRALTLIAMVEVFLLGLVLETEYSIESDSWLRISGPLVQNRVISIADIHRIEAIRSFKLAPAFSLDRLAIHYAINKMVVVSPGYQADFISNLKDINPHIEVSLF